MAKVEPSAHVVGALEAPLMDIYKGLSLPKHFAWITLSSQQRNQVNILRSGFCGEETEE